ncbi:hypothetical protein ABW21_db0200031 [Orbilia brochopaga]|nr:hypothetical protein ABW21_db0200031 [Drechslerella brochopaga]
MANSKFHTPSELFPEPHDPNEDYDAKGNPKKHIWGQVFLSAALDKPLPPVPLKTNDSNALGEFSLPPPPLRRRSWSHQGDEVSLYDEEAVTENILLDDFRGRSRYRPPSPPQIPWWHLQAQPTHQYQPLDQDDDAASDSSGLTTIWIDVDIEQRRAQSLPPLPPRKDECYRRKKTNPYWRLFRHHVLRSRNSTPSDQGMRHPLPSGWSEPRRLPPEPEEKITVREWVLFWGVMVFLGSYLSLIIWVGQQTL